MKEEVAATAARLVVEEGLESVKARKVDKLKATMPDGVTFRAVATEWYEKQAPQWSPSHAARSLRQLERDLYPWIGGRPMAEIHAMELLAVLQKVEDRGAVETADRVLMLARQVWDYWLPTAKVAQRNITEGLKKRLTPYRALILPVMTLAIVAMSYGVLLFVCDPFLSKSGKGIYNWIFIAAIVASIVWVILSWVQKSAALVAATDTRKLRKAA